MSPKAQHARLITAGCGLQPMADSQASACTSAQKKNTAVLEGSNAERTKPTSRNGPERFCNILYNSGNCSNENMHSDMKAELIGWVNSLTGNELASLMTIFNGKDFQTSPFFQKIKARQWNDRISNVKRSMEYQSCSEAGKTRGDKRKMDFATEESTWGTKKANGAAKAPVASPLVHGPTVNEQQSKQLDYYLGILNQLGCVLSRIKTEIIGLGQWIAPGVREKLDDLQRLLRSRQDLCNDFKETGKCLEFAGIIAYMSAFMNDFDSKKNTLEQHIREAKQAHALVHKITWGSR